MQALSSPNPRQQNPTATLHRRHAMVRRAVSSFAWVTVLISGPACDPQNLRAEVSGSGQDLCVGLEAGPLVDALVILEAEESAPPSMDRPWIRECVAGKTERLSDDVETYCSKLREIKNEDPLRKQRESDARHALVLALRTVAKECVESFRGSDQAAEGEEETRSQEEQTETIANTAREWCWSVPAVFDRFERAARDRIASEKLECLRRTRSTYSEELEATCRDGWKTIDDGASIVRRWYTECGV